MDRDQQVVAVLHHAHFGALGGRGALARFLLGERVDKRRLLPDRIVENAVDLRRLIDADGWDGIAFARAAGRRWVDVRLRVGERRRAQRRRARQGRCE